MNWFAGTNGSHGRDQASQQEKVWRDPAEEARVGRDLFLDDLIEDRPILVERPSDSRLIDRPGDRIPQSRPERRTAAASRAAAGSPVGNDLPRRSNRARSRFPELSWVDA
jgi:hypothetical protein